MGLSSVRSSMKPSKAPHLRFEVLRNAKKRQKKIREHFLLQNADKINADASAAAAAARPRGQTHGNGLDPRFRKLSVRAVPL